MALTLAEENLPQWIRFTDDIQLSNFSTIDEACVWSEKSKVIDGADEGWVEEAKLIEHLPLAALLATSVPISQFTEKNFGCRFSVKNQDGITFLDLAQGVILRAFIFFSFSSHVDSVNDSTRVDAHD